MYRFLVADRLTSGGATSKGESQMLIRPVSTGGQVSCGASGDANSFESTLAATANSSPQAPLPEEFFRVPSGGQQPGRMDPPIPINPGWVTPTDWNAVSPRGSSHPGKDPFNIIISGNSNVTLPQLESGLESVPHPTGGPPPSGGRFPMVFLWQPVATGTNLLTAGTGPEYANVQPRGQGRPVQQQLSMRVGGYKTELSDNINHFRLYRQQGTGAYFIAASEESFSFNFGGSFPWIHPYHDVVSFNQGRDDLLNDIKTAAKMQGWNVDVQAIPAEKPGTGSNGVHYDGVTYVVTLTHASGSPIS